MPRVSTKFEPISKEITLTINELLAPAAQSQLFAEYAKLVRNEAIAINRAALGRVPEYETIVDGREGASLESVKPTGTITFIFQLLNGVFAWIGERLVEHSPIGDPPLHYYQSHLFFADNVQVIPGEKVPDATEYAFVNAVPYARKIERGLSQQAPDGVYHVVADMAQKKFGHVARIFFTYRNLPGVPAKDDRQPAIVIRVKRRQ